MQKSVLVTAGASGIGLAIAEAFSGADNQVHIVDVDQSAVDILPDHFQRTNADVSNEDSVVKLIKGHIKRFGRIDVLINCAGIQGPTAPVEDISLAEWTRCLAVNLDAMYLTTRESVPHMKRQQKGNIINIASTAGWHGYPLRTPYAASKWGVVGFTKSLAMELGIYGIRCNIICPGSVSGARMDRVIAAEATKKEISEMEIREGYESASSLRTFISPDDIASMALFLASDSASKVTGQIMNVDGHLESFGGLNHGLSSRADRA